MRATHEAPLRPVRQRGPHLLAVDHPVSIAVGEPVETAVVATLARSLPGARLGVALAPQLGDVRIARKEPLLLRGGAERDQRRAEQFLAEVVDLVGRVGLGVLLVEGHPVRDRQAAPAVLDRPAQARQARRGQVPVPGQPLFEGLVLATRAAETLERGVVADQVVGQPLADLGPELLDRDHPCRLTYQALALVARVATTTRGDQPGRSIDDDRPAHHAGGAGPDGARLRRPRGRWSPTTARFTFAELRDEVRRDRGGHRSASACAPATGWRSGRPTPGTGWSPAWPSTTPVGWWCRSTPATPPTRPPTSWAAPRRRC